MNDKIKPSDLSIVSTRMGRVLTAVIAVFVIAVAVSAFLARGGSERNIIDMCVSDARGAAWALRVYEPLRSLVSRETRRPVVLHTRGEKWEPGHDVYIMPVHEFFSDEERLGIEAFLEVRASRRPNDDAILVAATSVGTLDYSTLSSADVAFSTPTSVNRFWVQMSMLAKRGFKPPALSDCRFEGTPGDGTRVVFGVLYGAYRVGACRLGDIAALAEKGAIRAEELRVLMNEEALPEIVIASTRQGSPYYQRKLMEIDALLEAVPSTQNETVRLLKAYGVNALRPLDPLKIEKTRALFTEYAGR